MGFVCDTVTPLQMRCWVFWQVQYSTGLLGGASLAKAAFLTQTLMPAAIAFFSSTLKVYPVSGNLKVPHTCSGNIHGSCLQCSNTQSPQTCGSYVTIPADHMSTTDQMGKTKYCTGGCDSSCTTYSGGTGVSSADFLIYVMAQTVGPCPATAGSGIHPTISLIC